MALMGAAALLSFVLIADVTSAKPGTTQPSESSLPQRADVAFQTQNWAEAAALYSRLTAAEKGRNVYWMRLGSSLRHLGRTTEALDAYRHAEAVGGPAI